MSLDLQESKHNSKLSIKISKNVNILPIIKSNFKEPQKPLINQNKPPNVYRNLQLILIELQFIKSNLQESK
jgi:hypothetical protein